MNEEPTRIALHLAALFEARGLAYAVVGSYASSIHGEDRQSHDIDFVVALP